ncbi:MULTISPECIES: hypothetical protein [Methylobacterium]|nr:MULTISPECIES: hypothetical protein [Methylobacterium]MDR7038974.1 hypothetical protein [Methylobacterium sp. BE186]
MVLTVFDPRAGTQIRIWVPAIPATPQPVPAAVIRHPRFARGAARLP